MKDNLEFICLLLGKILLFICLLLVYMSPTQRNKIVDTISNFIQQTKIGDTKVYVEGDEIIADYFPYASYGIGYITEMSINFDFKKFDKYVYKQVKRSNKPYLYVVIRHVDEDKYGNKTLGNKITIGKIDVNESKKYTNFYYWSRVYNSYNMWMNIREERNSIVFE